jgi:hypothetical protein
MSPESGPRIQVSATPNPNAMKFTLDRKLVESGSRSYSTRFEALDDPLGSALFGVPGVQSLFFMADFITVTKDPGAAWEELVPAVTAAVRETLAQG